MPYKSNEIPGSTPGIIRKNWFCEAKLFFEIIIRHKKYDLHFNFDIHSGRQIQAHQTVNYFLIGI
jgi:hypothetical protein